VTLSRGISRIGGGRGGGKCWIYFQFMTFFDDIGFSKNKRRFDLQSPPPLDMPPTFSMNFCKSRGLKILRIAKTSDPIRFHK